MGTVQRNAVFLDLNVLDHMVRIEQSRYSGNDTPELTQLRQHCQFGTIESWMAAISRVEMLMGQRSENACPESSARYEQKLAIASDMNVQWLSYPSTVTNRPYSLTNVTAQTSDRWFCQAREFEQTLILSGISRADAKQICTAIYERDVSDRRRRPNVTHILCQDKSLVNALTCRPLIPESVTASSVADFIHRSMRMRKTLKSKS